MRAPLPVAGLLLPGLLLAAGCYAEWDLPRCAEVADCPAGYSRCYTGYCLKSPIAGVDKAPLDASAPDAAPDTTPDTGPPEDVAADSAGPCAPSATADGCCPPGLLHLDQDPDCAAWVLSGLPFTTAAPVAVDVERGRLALSTRDGSGEATLRVLRLDTGEPAVDPVSLGGVAAPCPLILPDGSVVLAGGGAVRRVSLGASVAWTEIALPGASGVCPALLTPKQGPPVVVVVADAQPGARPLVVGIDAQTGALSWTSSPSTAASFTAPLVRNGVVITADADGALWRLDPQGKDVAATSLSLPGPPLLPPTGAGADGVHVLVYAAAKPHLVTARVEGTGWAPLESADDTPLDLAPIGGSEVVLFADQRPVIAHPTGFTVLPAAPVDVAPCGAQVKTGAAIAGDAVLLGTSDGATSVDRLGKTLWCYRTGRPALHPPVPLPDGDVLLVGEGVVLRVRAASPPLAASPWPRPRHDLANSAALDL